MLLPIRSLTGVRKTFDRGSITREEDVALLGFIPTFRVHDRRVHVIMVPVAELTDAALVGVTRVALLHRCQEYRQAMEARKLADILMDTLDPDHQRFTRR